MRKITDPETIRELVTAHGIDSCLDTKDLSFDACIYETGETLVSPEDVMDRVVFVVTGAVRIFGLLKDGTFTPVSRGEAPLILGDIEYTTGGHPVFFAGAEEGTLCLSLSLVRYRAVLDKDAAFLRTLLRSCAEKLSIVSGLDPVSMPLRERLLLCLEDERSGHEIRHLEPVLLKLRCSRRQLQRVLKELCEEGILEKTGKGHYRLLTPSSPAR